MSGASASIEARAVVEAAAATAAARLAVGPGNIMIQWCVVCEW